MMTMMMMMMPRTMRNQLEIVIAIGGGTHIFIAFLATNKGFFLCAKIQIKYREDYDYNFINGKFGCGRTRSLYAATAKYDSGWDRGR